MKKDSLYWDPDSQYEDYIKSQAHTCAKTAGRTRGDNGRAWAHNYLKNELKLNWKTMLCIGARCVYEPLFWKNLGYEADAIDLIPCKRWDEKKQRMVPSDYEGWRVCDMSKMHLDDYLKNKKYDLIYMYEALEHCLDLDGFITGLNLVCKKYFYSVCPYQQDPTEWDVARHPFMTSSKDDVWIPGKLWKRNRVAKEESKKLCRQKIKKCFSKFNIIDARIGYKNKIVMTLEKKDDL